MQPLTDGVENLWMDFGFSSLVLYSNLGDLQHGVAKDNFNSCSSALPCKEEISRFLPLSDAVIYTEPS